MNHKKINDLQIVNLLYEVDGGKYEKKINS